MAEIHSIFTSRLRYSRDYHQKLGMLSSKRYRSSSLNHTSGRYAPQHKRDVSENRVSVTYKNDTVNMPLHGTISLLDELASSEDYAKAQAENKLLEESTKRILVVEDDLTLARLEAGILTARGYTVATVHNGELAIASLRHSIPDLVVLDLELTGNVQGWDVLQALRDFASIPVLLTTSSTTAVRTSIRLRGENRSTLDHLPKPYPMQTLLKRVERMLMVAPQ